MVHLDCAADRNCRIQYLRYRRHRLRHDPGRLYGRAVGSLSTIIENDDGVGCAAFSSRLSFAATAGTTYRIRVDGYQGSDGTFKLDWFMTAPDATINKSVNLSSVSGVTTLTYTIIVDNSGTVDLTSPGLDRPASAERSSQTLTSGPTLTSGDVDSDGVLDTSETWIYSATYNVTSGNLNDGNDLINTATFNSNETSAVSDTATTTIAFVPAPSISVTKVANDTTDVTCRSADYLYLHHLPMTATRPSAISAFRMCMTAAARRRHRTLTARP